MDREAAARAIDAFLRALGRDPAHEPDLVGTAARIVEMYADDLCSGYGVVPSSVIAPHVMTGTTGVVSLRAIKVTTMCPHHLMPATGLSTVAFAPNQRLVGLGAIGKLVDVLAHRLVLQETIGEDVVRTLASELGPRWVACQIVLEHGCISARGDRRHGTKVETIAFAGQASDRAEAISLVQGCA